MFRQSLGIVMEVVHQVLNQLCENNLYSNVYNFRFKSIKSISNIAAQYTHFLSFSKFIRVETKSKLGQFKSNNYSN